MGLLGLAKACQLLSKPQRSFFVQHERIPIDHDTDLVAIDSIFSVTLLRTIEATTKQRFVCGKGILGDNNGSLKN